MHPTVRIETSCPSYEHERHMKNHGKLNQNDDSLIPNQEDSKTRLYIYRHFVKNVLDGPYNGCIVHKKVHHLFCINEVRWEMANDPDAMITKNDLNRGHKYFIAKNGEQTPTNAGQVLVFIHLGRNDKVHADSGSARGWGEGITPLEPVPCSAGVFYHIHADFRCVAGDLNAPFI